MAALVPMLCGFVPHESLVVVSLRGPRSRIGLTARIDLPPPRHEPELVAAVTERLRVDGARRALVVVCTESADLPFAVAADPAEAADRADPAVVAPADAPADAPANPPADASASPPAHPPAHPADPPAATPAGVAPGRDVLLPRAGLADGLERSLARAGIETADRLLLRAGRWFSYDCAAPGCCPPDGTPIEPVPTAAVALVAAEHAASGRGVLASREELVAALAAPADEAVVARLDRVLAAADRVRRRRLASEGRARVGRAALQSWRAALAEAAAGHAAALPEQRCASLVVSLTDLAVRDEVLTWVLDDDERLLTLLLHLAGRTVAPHDAAVCALVAWVAHARGDGALANVALDRALAAAPQYSLALLSRTALDGQVPPRKVRALLREARVALRRQHPWTSPAQAASR